MNPAKLRAVVACVSVSLVGQCACVANVSTPDLFTLEPATSARPPVRVPTPKLAVSLGMKEDSREWKIGHMAPTPVSFLMEMVPKGEEVASWQELSTSVVLFGVPLGEYLSRWKTGLRSAGASITEDEAMPDGSHWVSYASPSENGMWRYFQGPDGVYGVSYQTRPATEDVGRRKIWEGILRSASLVPNPISSR